MKTTPCKACRRSIPANAWKCPYCGIREPTVTMTKGFLLLGGLAAFIWILIKVFSA